ncbi:MAG: hypothetical protein ABEH83_13775 [Halobacterium sp.]
MSRKRQLATFLTVLVVVTTAFAGTGGADPGEVSPDDCVTAPSSGTAAVTPDSGCGSSPGDSPGGGGSIGYPGTPCSMLPDCDATDL